MPTLVYADNGEQVSTYRVGNGTYRSSDLPPAEEIYHSLALLLARRPDPPGERLGRVGQSLLRLGDR